MSRRGSTALVLGFLALAGVGLSAAEAAVPLPPTALAHSSPGVAALLKANAAHDPRGDGEDIRDIHGPIAIPRRRSPWWYVGAAGVAAGAAAGLILYARRPRPLAPPHARALRALAEAAQRFEGDPRQFSFAVSEIVRQYVEEAFPVRAAHRTTEELLADLMLDRSPVAPHRADLGEFLRYCDLAKFAGWSLSPADRTAMLASAETFIRATAEPPAPAPLGRAAVRTEGVA